MPRSLLHLSHTHPQHYPGPSQHAQLLSRTAVAACILLNSPSLLPSVPDALLQTAGSAGKQQQPWGICWVPLHTQPRQGRSCSWAALDSVYRAPGPSHPPPPHTMISHLWVAQWVEGARKVLSMGAGQVQVDHNWACTIPLRWALLYMSLPLPATPSWLPGLAYRQLPTPPPQ